MKTTNQIIVSLIALFFTISTYAAEENLALNASIHSYSGSTSSETPDHLIDGITSTTDLGKKWCEVGYKTHWVIIDLGSESEINRFKIYDCKTNESGQPNFGNYNIYVGNTHDNITQQVVSEKNNYNNIKEVTLSSPVTARFVKLEIPHFDIIRIWEFEIWGKGANVSITSIEDKKIIDGTILNVTASYKIKAPKNNFSYSVTSSNAAILISNKTETETEGNGSISFTVSAPASEFMSSEITVTVTNAGESVSKKFNVKAITTKPSAEKYANVSLSKPLNVRTYSPWADNNVNEVTDGNNTTYHETTKAMIEPILNLEEKYIVTAANYVYKLTSNAANDEVKHVSLLISEKIDAGHDDTAGEYITQKQTFDGTVVGKKSNSFVVFDLPKTIGTLKMKHDFKAWRDHRIELHELNVFCEKPVIEAIKDFEMEINSTKKIEIPFDLKGFALIDKKNITSSVTANSPEITINNIQADYLNNKIICDLKSGNTKAISIKITTTLSSSEFTSTSAFNVTTKSATGINLNNAIQNKVYPTLIDAGENVYITTKSGDRIRLISLTGKIIKEMTATKDCTVLDTSNLSPGAYIILSENGLHTDTSKIIVR